MMSCTVLDFGDGSSDVRLFVLYCVRSFCWCVMCFLFDLISFMLDCYNDRICGPTK
jgi:hypothetical protein